MKNIKTIKFKIFLDSLNKHMDTSVKMEIGADWTILDVIAEFDRQYLGIIKNDGKNHEFDFPAKDLLSTMQYIWDPRIQTFYEDVGFEARTPPPESKLIPCRDDWKTIISDGATIIVSPDANC